MKHILCLFLIIYQFSAFAQFDLDASLLEHNGGNGGDDDEIMIKNTLLQVGMFLGSPDGKILFSKEVDAKNFIETVKSTDFRVVDTNLTDKFSLKRCALNFPDKKLVVFNRSCLDNLRNNINDLYVLLTHEVLNVMGIELPDEKEGSVYTVSGRIGAVGALVIAKSKNVIFSSHCNLEVVNSFENSWKVPKIVSNILTEKGYNVQKVKTFSGRNYVLNIEVITQKYSHYKIDGNQILFKNGESAYIESSFLNNKFNGLIVMSIEGQGPAIYAPTPVSIKNYGEQHDATPKGFWRESMLEVFMTLPSCVKY